MAELLRMPVKYIRDRIKSQYPKGTECHICASTQTLEFHHYHSVAEMYKVWIAKNKLVVETAEDILLVRDRFIEDHWDEMINACVTLCKAHHAKLHQVYGKNPKLSTAEKQPRWVEKQRLKHIA